MKIKIELSQANEGQFASTKICYKKDDVDIKVPINIEFESLFDFSKDLESTNFDLFLISSIVYGIDNLFKRHIYSIDGWARDFEVTLPVKNIDKWENSKRLLKETLSFLTGDYWDIEFSKIDLDFLYFPRKNRRKNKIPLYAKSKFKYTSLFSGGLDSLVGVIDYLEQLSNSKKILLISHFDSNSVGPSKDQNHLYDYLNLKYHNKIDWIQSTISLSNVAEQGIEIYKDNNYRSRSFLFLGLGQYLVNSTDDVRELIIPENGTISLNYPLTPSRSSSLSTRTTHPYFLMMYNQLLSSLDIKIKVINPYIFKTKGELILGCRNIPILKDIFIKSVSCGKRGRRQYWSVRSGTNHCGTCMPCIYRRAALNKIGWDSQLYGNDLLSVKNINAFNDLPAFVDYLDTELTKDKIKRNLLVNGSLPLNFLDQYADLIIRSRDELKNWISQNGKVEIKRMIRL